MNEWMNEYMQAFMHEWVNEKPRFVNSGAQTFQAAILLTNYYDRVRAVIIKDTVQFVRSVSAILGKQ